MFQHQEDGKVLFETEDFTSVCSPTGVYTVHDVLAWVCLRAQCMASWRMRVQHMCVASVIHAFQAIISF